MGTNLALWIVMLLVFGPEFVLFCIVLLCYASCLHSEECGDIPFVFRVFYNVSVRKISHWRGTLLYTHNFLLF